jgi:molybdopterin-guanine dinucleotide biosynthesis adapter protein
MRVIGPYSWGGAGKTTPIVKLIQFLGAQGSTVLPLKHAHHAFELDKPSKEPYDNREVGVTDGLLASVKRWALMHELQEAKEPAVFEFLRRMSLVDLVLVEGYT